MDSDQTVTDMVTVICTGPECGEWYFRGRFGFGYDAARKHADKLHDDGEPLGPNPVTIIEDVEGESPQQRRERIGSEVRDQAGHERTAATFPEIAPLADYSEEQLAARVSAAQAADEHATQAEADRQRQLEAEGPLAVALDRYVRDHGPFQLGRTLFEHPAQRSVSELLADREAGR